MTAVKNRRTALRLGAVLILLAGLFAIIDTGFTRQFRTLRPIATPEKIPAGATRVERFQPVDRRLVEAAVYALAEAWNTGQLDPMLSRDRFYNKDRLLDTISEVAPRDAVLRVQSVSGISTLEQYYQPRNGFNRQVSIVAAIVRTQLEFQDPEQGFVRLDGRNEFVLEIEQPAPATN